MEAIALSRLEKSLDRQILDHQRHRLCRTEYHCMADAGSFSTLTTVGFGDITPLTPPAKSFAMIEAVVGPMFVAVFLARLVGVRTLSH
ncbi:potassium channel family protein [Thiorhodovibrio frisius]|uniref:potassium channel family protein n=1 Tax=Thiorhodovibrio frisius TaxID=631362 RepID=UPI00022C70D3|nr:potassium channel family protein [Thiorhodovibrio frisius]WPL21843.1 Ion channel [Thiorhodovibrio frisius]